MADFEFYKQHYDEHYWSFSSLLKWLRLDSLAKLSDTDIADLELLYEIEEFGTVEGITEGQELKRVYVTGYINVDTIRDASFENKLNLWNYEVCPKTLVNGEFRDDLAGRIFEPESPLLGPNLDTIQVDVPKSLYILESKYGPMGQPWYPPIKKKMQKSLKPKPKEDYSTTLLEVLNDVIDEFWTKNAKQQGPHKKPYITSWILEKYKDNPDVSKNMAEAIDTITRPKSGKTKRQSKSR